MINSLVRKENSSHTLPVSAAGLVAVAMAVTISLLSSPPVSAQTPAPPVAFEVASVKLHKPEPGPLRVSTAAQNGRITFVNVTLKACIRQAYGLRPYQVAGGPGWLADDRYDIVAKAAGPASKTQLMPMLQALLADRFKLTFHIETKEMPVYSLVIAKKGSKIHAVKDDGNGLQIGADPEHPFSARNISMAQFAGALSRDQAFDFPILDRTGLTGVFNITLDFVPDDATSTDTAVGPSILTALQEQLGLKLEAAKGPMEILVIDHAERPSEN